MRQNTSSSEQAFLWRRMRRKVAQDPGGASRRTGAFRRRGAVSARSCAREVGSKQGLMKILRLGSDQMRGAGAAG